MSSMEQWNCYRLLEMEITTVSLLRRYVMRKNRDYQEVGYLSAKITVVIIALFLTVKLDIGQRTAIVMRNGRIWQVGLNKFG
ncbi:hypothetical protein AAY84_16440 [Serratia marcescens]|nr:hypothetical protein AAY84_16440 [Serratia marcescens]